MNNSSKQNPKAIFLFPRRDVGWWAFAKVVTKKFPGCPVGHYDLCGGKLAYSDIAGDDVRKLEQLESGFGGTLVIPLFAATGENKITPMGLELVSYLRDQKENFQFSVLFLVVDDFFTKDGKLKHSVPYFLKNLLVSRDDPKSINDLNQTLRATLFAELIFPTNEDHSPTIDKTYLGRPVNICNICGDGNLSWDDTVSTSLEEVCESLRTLTLEVETIANAREDFYMAFYTPYEWQGKSPFGGDIFQEMKKIDGWLQGTRNETNTDHHHIPVQLFRPPIPFFLWIFFLVYDEVTAFYLSKGSHDLPMFLIDNVDFSSKENDKENKVLAINNIFKRYSLRGGDTENYSPSGFDVVMKPKSSKTGNEEEKGFILEDGCFEHAFMEADNDKSSIDFFTEKGKSWTSVVTRTGLIKKAKGQEKELKIYFSDYLIIFLDFFLSKDKLFVAHRFIREYNRYKMKNYCFQTDWFFIVSSAHRDVLEYANAGSMSSFSATTRVDFGDNPLLENRRIIFLYKLLQLLQSRIHRFNHSWGVIKGKYISEGKGECQKCKEYIPADAGKRCPQCLENGLEFIRQFLFACADEKSSFSSIDLRHNQYVIAQRLETILRDFLLRPKADWAMIQLQIDYLEGCFAEEDLKFTCSFIKTEMKNRSNVY